MRLTSILCQINYHRHFQRIWKRQGKMEVKPVVLSPELQEMGVKIEDAKGILHESKLFKPETKKIAGLPYPLPPSVFTSEVPYYKMHSDVKVSENENQALCLTKTVPYKGLPKKICSLIGHDSLVNQDELVQTSILQAQVWDSMQEKLPRIIHPEKPPGYVCKRQFGIEYEKKVSGLLEKLSYLCDSATGRYENCFQTHKTLNAFAEIEIKRCENNIIFQMPCDILIKSKKPLESFASLDEVQATENETVPNIYPIKPTLDLEKCKENPICNHEFSLPDISLCGSIHTLLIAQKADEWLPSQQLAKAIATCFAFAAAEARFKYGDNVKILPQPISIQCMYIDVKTANFLAYQLNTLKLEDNEGIKNQVWIDEATDFYQNVSEVDLITDYNPSVFPKMLAMHINGLHSES